VPERFDATYYRRFYARTSADRRQIGHLATGVFAFAAYWSVPIHSVLDVGAGKGYWRDWLALHHRRVSYHGIDVSDFASRRYGHEQADLATWTPSRSYDLVVCRSVLQYLDNRGASQAIETLGAACRELLLFEAPTIADLETVVDRNASDLDGNWRSGRWYRSRLDRVFIEIGGGLWLSRTSPAPFFELERSR
jgi:hypothetical protein